MLAAMLARHRQRVVFAVTELALCFTENYANY